MALLALVDVDGTLLLNDDPVAGEAFGSALRDCYPVEPPTDAVKETKSQFLLKLAQLARKGRLADTQADGCLRDRA